MRGVASTFTVTIWEVLLSKCVFMWISCKKKVNVRSYIAQYPILRIAQSTLHFTSLTDLFNHTPSQLLWETSSHMLQLMREGCSYTYPPLSTATYSFIQLGELEQCRVKKHAQGFNTAAQDLNPDPVSREYKALPLSSTYSAWPVTYFKRIPPVQASKLVALTRRQWPFLR